MSQRGKVRFELGFDVERTENGRFITFNAIDLEAPGLKYFDFYTTVEGWMAEAMFSMASKISDIEKLLASVDADEARENVAAKGSRGQLEMLKGAMGHKEYSEFLSYIRKHLTNTPLARATDSKQPITADMWEDIAEQGGITIIMDIIGKYLDFFTDTKTEKATSEKPSPACNGSGLSVTPA